MSKPQKPPPSRLEDLSIYSSPHSDYTEHVQNELICKEYRTSLMHKYVFPKVKKNRIAACNFFKYYFAEARKFIDNVASYASKKKTVFFNQTRHPDNYQLRRAVVATGAVLSFIYGMKKGRYKDSILKGTFYSAITSLATGYVCFPNATDEAFQNTVYCGFTAGIGIYNIFASDKINVESLTCTEDLPTSTSNQKNKEVKRFPPLT